MFRSVGIRGRGACTRPASKCSSRPAARTCPRRSRRSPRRPQCWPCSPAGAGAVEPRRSTPPASSPNGSPNTDGGTSRRSPRSLSFYISLTFMYVCGVCGVCVRVRCVRCVVTHKQGPTCCDAVRERGQRERVLAGHPGAGDGRRVAAAALRRLRHAAHPPLRHRRVVGPVRVEHPLRLPPGPQPLRYYPPPIPLKHP
jgi:hypothetical protein